MHSINHFEDLQYYHAWWKSKLFGYCDGLSDMQLDESQPMGFGTLRGTLFHILTAERVWMDRWKGRQPPEKFPTDPMGISVDGLREGFAVAAAERNELIQAESADGWSREFQYRDFAGNAHKSKLDDALTHVFNHGVYHQAQAVHYLKRFGRVIPVGLDYLLYKLAKPSVPQSEECASFMTGRGIECGTGQSSVVAFEMDWLSKYLRYDAWAIEKIFESIQELSVDVINKPMDMGIGSIRATIAHCLDAWRFWFANWTSGPAQWQVTSTEVSITEMLDRYLALNNDIVSFVHRQDSETIQRVVAVSFGGPEMQFRILETVVQLCSHGTYHRAQLNNMVRRLEGKPRGVDYILYTRTVA